MTDDTHSGSRWEPQLGSEGAAGQPVPPSTVRAVPPASPPPSGRRKRRTLAALSAAGLVLGGGAGGWAIGSAAAGSDDPATQETGVDGPPGGHDGRPDPGGRGVLPDRSAPDGDPA